MINKNKLISELENVIYGSNMPKKEADNLLTNFINLINKLKLRNCSVNILQNPIKLVIKNKAYDNRVFFDFIKNTLYINNEPILIKDVNTIKDFLLTKSKK